MQNKSQTLVVSIGGGLTIKNKVMTTPGTFDHDHDQEFYPFVDLNQLD